MEYHLRWFLFHARKVCWKIIDWYHHICSWKRSLRRLPGVKDVGDIVWHAVPSRLLLNMQRRGLTGEHRIYKFANVGRSLFLNKNISFQGPAFQVISIKSQSNRVFMAAYDSQVYSIIIHEVIFWAGCCLSRRFKLKSDRGAFKNYLADFFSVKGVPPPHPPYPLNRKSFCQKTLSGKGGYTPTPP